MKGLKDFCAGFVPGTAAVLITLALVWLIYSMLGLFK